MEGEAGHGAEGSLTHLQGCGSGGRGRLVMELMAASRIYRGVGQGGGGDGLQHAC